MALEMAVVAPIPRARQSTADSATVGDRLRLRAALRSSMSMAVTKFLVCRRHGFDSERAAKVGPLDRRRWSARTTAPAMIRGHDAERDTRCDETRPLVTNETWLTRTGVPAYTPPTWLV